MKDLAIALAKFQATFTVAPKDSKGNYGTYTSLAAVLSVAKEGSAFGFCHLQTLRPLGMEAADVGHILTTTLLHVSGEQIQSEIFLPSKTDTRGNYMQALGSALTYARRYALLAIYGLAADDDDCQSSAHAPLAATPSITRAKAIIPATAVLIADEPSVFLDTARQASICAALKASEQKAEILDAFKAEFNISSDTIVPSQIQLPAHADFIEARLSS